MDVYLIWLRSLYIGVHDSIPRASKILYSKNLIFNNETLYTIQNFIFWEWKLFLISKCKRD